MDLTFELLGEDLHVKNRERFKKIEGTEAIFAVKRYQIRILGFYTPRKEFLLMFGLLKKSNKYKRKDINKAESTRDRYFSEMEHIR